MYDPSGLYVDPILTGFSLQYEEQNLYGEDIMPLVPVDTQSGRYRVFDRSAWMIFPDRREPGTVANEIRGGKWSEDTFFTKEHSLQAPIHDEERQQLTSLGGLANPAFGGDLDIEPERDATNLVTRAIRLGHELKVSTAVRNTANYAVGNTVTLAGSQQWDDYTGGTGSTSDPVTVIRTAIRTVRNLTGRTPNMLVMPYQGIEYVENHPRVVARYSNFQLLDPEAFQRLSGFQGRVLEVDSVYNAADNIDAAEDIQSFWGKDVWLGIVDPGAGVNGKTFGKTFVQRYPTGDIRPIERWREIQRKTDVVRASEKYDLKVVSNVAGYLIKNAFGSTAW